MSIFPFINPETITESEAVRELPMFKEYAYDYEANELLLNGSGNTYLVEGNEAIRIWIHKALSTKRFRYTAYSPAFGSEWENLIGKVIEHDIYVAELKRYIIESLMVNPYIKELSEFSFHISANQTQVAFNCLTVYGSDEMQFMIEGVDN